MSEGYKNFHNNYDSINWAGPSPPGVNSLVKRMVLGMFLGAQSAKICGIPRFSTIFMEMCGNM